MSKTTLARLTKLGFIQRIGYLDGGPDRLYYVKPPRDTYGT